MHSSVYGITRYLLAMLEMDANLAIIHIDVRSLVDTLRRLQPQIAENTSAKPPSRSPQATRELDYQLKTEIQSTGILSLVGRKMGMLFISTVVRLWQ